MSSIENEWSMWRLYDQFLDEGFSPVEAWEKAQEKLQEPLAAGGRVGRIGFEKVRR